MSKTDPITAHILDTNTGTPASQVIVQLYTTSQNSTTEKDSLLVTSKPFAMAKTDNDGRIKTWSFDPDIDYKTTGIVNNEWEHLIPGVYKAKFLTGKYFKNKGSDSFFPFVEIFFEIDDPKKHYHIPLLLSNYSYTTYRGS
ncbi:hypothetical protein KGF54_003271 [Candida jiufengensis]|uniref:uncharacterized protein n=1 Tax=Candida jiufengensis TaxID=497108 RepID=UPI002224F2D8|nr:uncharacterized protein KGF54_003271 [Candida jiufengensis]KAI5952404.1 hypothetical protein KGF54_003271 [Candida jiufengensis]